MSSISIHPAGPDDVGSMVAVSGAAFENDPLHRASKPLEMTEEQTVEYNAWRTRMSITILKDPNAHYFKAVDHSTGKLVGLCGWSGPVLEGGNSNQKDVAGGEEMPVFLKKEVLESLGKTLKELKGEVLGDRVDYWMLQTIAVHPDYQGRGIGRRLAMDGLENLVDEDGLDAYVQASEVGVGLYKSCGFEEKMCLPLLGGVCTITGLLRKARKHRADRSNLSE